MPSLARPRRVLVAPDSFKGSLGALEAAQAMARGIRAVFPDWEIRLAPVADGGEGTVDALVAATGGQRRTTIVPGPLGEPVEAAWGVLGDGCTAVIEVAAASGLTLLPPERRDPRLTSSAGTGFLVKAALDAGFRRMVAGLGGSATNDGGAGLARALGARFLDAGGAELAEGGAALLRLDRLDLSGLDPRLAECTVRVACDVTAPLTGPGGASEVFGPQKGATPEAVAELDRALGVLAEVATRATDRNVARLPGAGAAGGLGAGLLWFTPARLEPGVNLVLEALGLEDHLRDVDLVITGEGSTDAQTALGKAPAGVALAARRHGVPVLCLSGNLEDGAEALLDLGVQALASLPPGPLDLATCLAQAAPLLEAATARACRLLALGATLAGGKPDPERHV
jgi:glycerate 2-kinase